MSYILSIETATDHGSVAIHLKGNLIGEINVTLARSHSKILAENIKFLLKQTDLSIKDLNAVAVSGGPGSYTGLRIGVSTAKGIAMAADIPLIHIDTLHIMKEQVKNYYPHSDYLYCPMIDARRMEVYMAVINSSDKIVYESQPMILNDLSLHELSESKLLIFGNGSEKAESLFVNKKWTFIKDIHPRAGNMGTIGYRKFVEGEVEDLALYEPNYIKPFKTTTPKAKINGNS